MKHIKIRLSMLALLLCFTFSLHHAAAQSELNDAEIAAIAVAANQSDISFAQVAKDRSKNAEIIKFAETMARDHKAVIEQAVALVTKLKVTPQASAVSRKMTTDAETTVKSLRNVPSKKFDKAYIDNEVTYHANVIAAVESILIPQARNAELKSLLQAVLPALKAHLSHAQMVQKMFK